MRTKISTTGINLPSGPSHHSGFTLIELLLVLVILLMTSGLVVSRLNDKSPNTQLLINTSNLASYLRYSQSNALLKDKPVCVHIDHQEGTYYVDEEKKQRFDKGIELRLIVTDVKKNSTIGNICFFNDGSSTGGEVELKLKNMTKTLVVNWITGGIKVV